MQRQELRFILRQNVDRQGLLVAVASGKLLPHLGQQLAKLIVCEQRKETPNTRLGRRGQ